MDVPWFVGDSHGGRQRWPEVHDGGRLVEGGNLVAEQHHQQGIEGERVSGH